jgi:class 3 adenylate cyclase
MQQAMPEFNRRFETDGIAIRVGLHSGSSIAVALNDRLDYYGEAVNLTARLEDQGDAGEIVMSKAFTEDPAVNDILSDYEPRKQQLDLKGFENPVEICLIRPRSENDKSTASLEAVHY